MATSLLELGISTGKWDAGLRKAQSSLNNFVNSQGGLEKALEKENEKMSQFVRMMGNMDSTAKTAKGQMNDYKNTLEQLTAQYSRMTEAQKKTIGTDYLQAIDKLKGKFHEAKQQVEDFNKSLNGIDTSKIQGGGGLFGGGKLDGMLQVFGGNVMTKLAGVGVGFVADLGEAVKQSVELAKQGEGVRLAFERLGRGDILQGLREATHGTVTDLELMKAAVKFNDFKLPVEELGTMLAFAQQKAKDTGQSIDYMVDSIVTGLGRKSLMILDNLGLSAAEIKEKMKETGDMTKAVGAIIREQMSKAGDYVETAADRATKADVQLKNAMEDLGRTFQPLSDSANDMWTNIKVGALDLLNSAVRPLIDALTEAGRLRRRYLDQNGNQRVHSMLDRLESVGTDTSRRNLYNNQLREFDTHISSYQQYLADYKKWQSDKTAIGAYDRMQAFQKRTGLSFVSDVKAQLAAFQQMRSEYVQGAKAILEKTPAPSPTVNTTSTTSTTTTATPAASDIMNSWLTASLKGAVELQKQKDAGQLFKDMPSIYEMMLPEIQKQILDKKDFDYGKDITDKGNKKEQKEDKQISSMDQLSKVASGLSSVMSGLSAVGFSIPKELQTAINVIQGAISVMQGVQTVISVFSTSAENANTFALGINTAAIYSLEAALWANTSAGIIPGLHTGGFLRAAIGTQVPGNFGYDAVPYLLTSGETVLTKAQTAQLANELENEDRGIHIAGVIEGENIVLVANRSLRRQGKGELVTWKD